MDRTREFLVAAARCSNGLPVPRLGATYRTKFNAAASSVSEGISTVLAEVVEVVEADEAEDDETYGFSETEALLRQEETCLASGQKLFQATGFIAAAGREIATLDTLASKFSSAAAHTELAMNTQYTAHQKGIVVVLYSRLKILSELVAHAEGRLKLRQKQSQRRRKRLQKLVDRGASDEMADGYDTEQEAASAFEESGLAKGSAMPLLRLARSVLASKAISLFDGSTKPVNSSTTVTKRDVLTDATRNHDAPRSAVVTQQQLPEELFHASSQHQAPAPAAQVTAQALMHRDAAALQDDSAQRIERQMREVSGMIELISSHLLEQSEDVGFILDSAVTARDNIRQGNKELKEASERPNTFRDMAVMIMLLLAAVLLFLDRWSR